MKFVAKLFGLTCFFVFGFAAVMSLIGEDNIDTINKKIDSVRNETDLSENDQPVELSVTKNREELVVPDNYKIQVSDEKKVSAEFVDAEQIKKLLAQNKVVTVFLNNAVAKNPFVPEDEVFMVRLIGYSDTHFFSDGSEVRANEFTYLIADFAPIVVQSKSKIWY